MPQAEPVGAKEHMGGTKMIFLGAALFTALGVTGPQNKNERKSAPKPPSAAAETYLKYCASCHGKTAKGDGPAAFVFSTPLLDLTTLSKRHENKFPAGYVGVVLTFVKRFASHGSEDMPVLGIPS
jgi:mono/diheme cytochrome c family protein